MKILITSYAYAPSVGGIETVTRIMAAEFVKAGHNVRIVTHTEADRDYKDDWLVLRKPSVNKLRHWVRWADVVWQNGIALSYLWAPILMGKPAVVTLTGAIYWQYPKKPVKERIKAFALRYCHVMAISPYVMNDVKVPYDLVGNPFERPSKTVQPEVHPKRDLVFVGRLVSDKGADMLVDAMSRLLKSDFNISCTIIGDGPERAILERRVVELGIGNAVNFKGILRGNDLYREIARHRIMVVPSRWREPFGIVALEGIACGCMVIGSGGGGLGMAIGPCGLTFPNESTAALTESLQRALEDSTLYRRCRSHAEEHLQKFELPNQAAHYLSVFEAIRERKQPPKYGMF